jgi:hypothetical protein
VLTASQKKSPAPSPPREGFPGGLVAVHKQKAVSTRQKPVGRREYGEEKGRLQDSTFRIAVAGFFP